MEEDTGKSLHVGGATGRIHGADYSLVDYNRAGIPLIEIVTKPIMGAREKAPLIAKAYVAQLRELIVALGVSDARMDQGSIRADVNLSLAPGRHRHARHPHRDQERQLAALGRAGGALRDAAARRRSSHGGGSILQETRHWHEDTGDHHQRSREVRRRGLPLLPRARPGAGGAVARVGRGAARHAAGEPDRRSGPGCRPSGASPTSRCATPSGPARSAWSRRPSRPGPPRRPPASGGSREMARRANESGSEIADLGVTPADVARVQALVDAGTINDKLARQVFDGLLAGEGTPDEIVEARGLAHRLRRRRPRRGRRQRDRRQPRRRRQDPRRQGRRRRRPDRRGDEGDARPGRRRPGPRADPREADLSRVGRRWAAQTPPSRRSCAGYPAQLRRLGRSGRPICADSRVGRLRRQLHAP